MTQSKRLLLHSCCGPCSTAVIERLIDDYEITLFFYNPNITDRDEYLKRLETQKLFIDSFNEKIFSDDMAASRIKLIEGDYNPDSFYHVSKGLENEKEGGKRCTECFRLRLGETAARAKSDGFDIFGTTLTVSPHKNAPLINEIGDGLSDERGVEYLRSDFKKKDGYRRSVQLSKEYGLYRQNYCGCEYSKWWENEIR